MPEKFDPYYTWLGIPPEEQPPDYYRLLGIRRFESNAEVIANALDQRMGHIRSTQSGPHASDAHEILNELSQAGGCLLTTDRKGQYDRDLRQKDAPKLSKSSSEQTFTRPSAPVISTPAPAPAAAPAAPKAAAPPVLRTATPLAGAPAQTAPMQGQPLQVAQPLPAPSQPIPVQSQPMATGPSSGMPIVVAKPSAASAPVEVAPRPMWQPLLLLGLGGVALVVLGAVALVGTYFGAKLMAKGKETANETQKVAKAPKVTPKPVESSVKPSKRETTPSRRPVVPTPPVNPPLPIPVTPSVAVESKAPSAVTSSVDLLKDFDKTRQVTAGSVRKTPSRSDGVTTNLWITEGRDLDIMQFPVELPEEYVVETSVARRPHFGSSRSDDDSGMVQGLVVGDQQCMVTVDGFNPQGMRTLLDLIDGKRGGSAADPCEYRGKLLKTSVRTDLKYYVYKDRLAVECDGKTVLDWKGGNSRLSLEPFFKAKVPDPKALFFGSWKGSFALTRFEVRPMRTGEVPPIDMLASAADPARPPVGPFPPVTPPVGPGPFAPRDPVGPGTTPKPATPSATKKLAVPEDKELETVRSSVKDTFKLELSKAIKPAEKVALADAFLTEAKTGKAVDRYVLFEAARNLKFDAGDMDGAFAVVDKVVAQFDVDPWKERKAALQRGLEKADSMPERKRMFEIAMHQAETELVAAKFEPAGEAADVAVSAATRMGDNKLKTAGTALKDGIEKAKGQYDKALAASELLKTEPDNADANATWGKFLSLMQRDWKQGLPLLAKGSDEPLKKAVVAESAAPPDPEAAAKAWDDASQAYTGRERDSLLLRARELYQKAAATAGELGKRRVQKRIDEITALLPKDLDPVGRLTPKIAGATAGMIGRVAVNGRDPGLLVKYEPGAPLTHIKLTESLARISVSGTDFTVDLRGVLHMPEAVTVEVRNSTGGKFGVFPDLTINGKRVQELAENRGQTESYFIPLPKGEHLLVWTLRGRDLGACELSFSNVETSEPLYVYFNQLIGRTATSIPTRGELSYTK